MQSTAFAITGYKDISPKSRIGLAVIALVAALSTSYYGTAVHGRALLEKYPADWTAFGWFKMSISLSAALLLFVALRPPVGAARRIDLSGNREGKFLAGCAWVSGATLLGASVIVLTIPEILNQIVREGQPAGILTDVAFMVALAHLCLCMIRARRIANERVFGIRPSLVYFAMFFVTFLILMEEMSWGQHWFGFATGELFAGNAQNETNIHNFYTYKFEAAYYSAAFVVFVALPNFWPRHNSAPLSALNPYIPPRAFALLGLPLAGLWFEEWNVMPYQIWFFMGVFIAAHVGSELWRGGGAFRWTGVGMAALMLLSQFIFLTFGHNMVDGYELSEIRELLIAFLIAVYARISLMRLAALPLPHKSLQNG
jgi:hypothetical protein